ncbi:hypothetical protein B0J13DRAFT_537571 [Dactylonectria estremocensis]|uniref:Uncharacterized protein n=1 Tax=Dactylonectria estremocensis TaxID=1079267 RepID=A0A9P9FLC3_9HYPO|nr:hypothetical protein B0J13DRAFT_537571 [Dactylonectria estremocensis]
MQSNATAQSIPDPSSLFKFSIHSLLFTPLHPLLGVGRFPGNRFVPCLSPGPQGLSKGRLSQSQVRASKPQGSKPGFPGPSVVFVSAFNWVPILCSCQTPALQLNPGPANKGPVVFFFFFSSQEAAQSGLSSCVPGRAGGAALAIMPRRGPDPSSMPDNEFVSSAGVTMLDADCSMRSSMLMDGPRCPPPQHTHPSRFGLQASVASSRRRSRKYKVQQRPVPR